MKKQVLIAAASAAAIVTAPAAFAPVAAEGVKVGYMQGFAGGRGIFGRYGFEGFELALDHLGGKFGGMDVELTKKDTQHKPDVGRTIMNEFIKKERVNFVAGITWSNVLAAVWKQASRSKTYLISANAGWSGMAGKNCNPYFFQASWNNDMIPEAMGRLMKEEGIKDVFELSANYQAGKDMLSGFNRRYQTPTKGKILYKLGNNDWQAEISQIRSIKPSAIFGFLPGGMGVSFMKQYKAAGLDKTVKLYTVYTVDHGTIGAHGTNAIGSYHTTFWNSDAKTATNQKFIKDYIKKYGKHPSMFSVQGYDAALLIDLGVKGSKGNLKDHKAITAAMRTAAIDSPRGKFSFNVNHSPIQDYYKREVIAGPDGKPQIVVRGKVASMAKDSHYQKCKMKW
jgi:branched-chain amino acid transport system substrate-binding protein